MSDFINENPPVNDVPGSQFVGENGSLAFSSGGGNPISVSDVDDPSQFLVTLSVAHGTLTFTNLAGLSFSSGDGVDDETMVFWGDAGVVNTALQGLVYNPAENYVGPDSLSVTSNDVGNNGLLNQLTDTDFVAITVTPVTDEPAVAYDDSFTTDELTPITGNVFADNGSGADDDPDGPPLSISAVNGYTGNVGTQITLPSGALLTVNSDGTFNYDPNGAFEYTPTLDSGATNTPSGDTFSYTLAGGDTATVFLTIDGVDNNDTVVGDDDANVLTGGIGNDLIFGLDGNDLLRGRAGDDTIDGGEGFDRAGYYHVDEEAGGVTVDLNIADAQDTGSQGWDTLTSIEYVSGTPFADVLIGDGNDNILWGSTATIDPESNWVSTTNNDTLDGGGGNDLLYVGIGNHSLTGGDGVDTVGFTENFGDDPAIHISLLLQGQAQDTGQGLWTLNGIENLSGGDDDDTLIGDDNANILAGSAGNDTLSGGGGNDTLYGDGAFDSSSPSSGPPTLFPDIGANGNDTLDGGAGDDQLYGGGGNDTASFASEAGAVQAFLYNGGNGEAFTSDGYDQLHSIENLTGSAFGDQLAGNNLANVLSGGDGNDVLSGAGGNDTLNGGAGNDSLVGGGGNDANYGGSGDDFIRAGFGDDLIDGADGYDRAGYYQTDEGVGGVTVNLNIVGPQNTGGQGWDTLVGIEYVSGTPFADTLIGDAADNILWGSSATIDVASNWVSTSNNDTLDGGDGNDLLVVGIGNHSLTGGSGIDTLGFTENFGDDPAIHISLLLQGQAQDTGQGTWTLSGIENLSGGNDNDSLTGDGNANILAGWTGNDTLAGGAGNDSLYGDGRFSSGAPASGPITFYADADASLGDIAGDDTLEGGAGDDLLYGGGGNDTASYASASGGVTAVLYNGSFGEAVGAAGYDQLNDMENLGGSAFNDVLVGNSADNVISGGAGHDLVRGNAGNDTLLGGDGDDYLDGGIGDDILDGGAGIDRLSYFGSATGPVTIDLRIQGVAQDTGQGLDTLIGIEHVGGTVYGDTLTGDSGDNWLRGSSDGGGNDILDGQGGNDLIEDGAGDHQLNGGTGIDTFLYSTVAGPGISVSLALQGGAQTTGVGSMTLTGIENLSGSFQGDALTGDGGNNILAGAGGNDQLAGGAGNDALYGDGAFNIDTHGTLLSGPITLQPDTGAAGNDTLEGGLGNDTLDGGGGSDTASYEHASGAVTATLLNNTTGNGNSSGADGNDTLAGIENLTGSAYNDSLTGNALANALTGGGGHDSLRGNAGNDTLIGGDGDDFLSGGMGDDVLDGGAGFDRVSYLSGATAAVTIDLNIQGVAQNTIGAGMDTLIGIENASGTIFNDTLIGDGNDNWLWGGSDGSGVTGNDVIDAGAGNDLVEVGTGTHTLAGGTGIDTLSLSGNSTDITAAGVTFSLALQGAAQDTEQGMMNTSGFENVSGSIYGDVIIGDGGINVLAGAEGNDSLSGGAGNDVLYGDGEILADNHGTGASGPITLVADVGANGNDVLEGGLGNDTLDGGGGSDTASYVNASGAVTVTLTASGGSSSGSDGADTLQSIENITGGVFNDILTGNGDANTLDGGGGHDKLSGGAGNDALLGNIGDDSLTGGAGDDIYNGGVGFDRANFFGASNGVTVNLTIAGAQNTGQGMDTLIGIENLSGTQFSDTLIGDANDNWLWGFATTAGSVNNDTLNGGGGNDLLWAGNGNMNLIGGTGNDTVMYNQNFTGDVAVKISLAVAGGQNTGQGTWTLTGIENLVGGTANDTLTGDGNANILAGGAGTDTIDGGAGNDTIYGDGEITFDDHGTGGSGPIIIVPDAIATYGGVAGNDNLSGGDGDDFIYGGAGNDVIKGDKGDDTLYGGTGNDTLTGGQGIDRYVIEANSGADTISGFAHLVDSIVFDDSSGVTSFAQLTMTKVGGSNTLITWGNGNSITITGLKPADLSAGDFKFNPAAAGYEHVNHDFATSFVTPHDMF